MPTPKQTKDIRSEHKIHNYIKIVKFRSAYLIERMWLVSGREPQPG